MNDLYNIAEKHNNLAHSVKYGTTLEEKKEYRREQNNIVAMFKKDLLEYLEIIDHPKAEKLFSLAWEHGHGSGFGDVATLAEEYAELLK